MSLLFVDVGVELLLIPKMSSSSSSSSKNGEALAFFVEDLGLMFWKRSSLLSSKMDGRVFLSLSFFRPTSLVAGGAGVLVVCLETDVFVTLNRLSEPKRSSSSEGGSTFVLLLSLLESFFSSFDTGSVSAEGLREGSGRED